MCATSQDLAAALEVGELDSMCAPKQLALDALSTLWIMADCRPRLLFWPEAPEKASADGKGWLAFVGGETVEAIVRLLGLGGPEHPLAMGARRLLISLLPSRGWLDDAVSLLRREDQLHAEACVRTCQAGPVLFGAIIFALSFPARFSALLP
eukprot:SAG11_NODE_740_length_7421_cov_6.264818_3_plen_152_part_00